jgi:hypothetical protein
LRKSLVTIIGVASILMGLLWIGQGLGFIQWPASSFMLDQRPWAVRGAVAALFGILLIVLANRSRAA